MATTQDEMIAELQRANMVLQQERDTARVERDTALAQRNTEYGERIEHQSATIEVLKAMSASPGDPQPVFDLIVDRARELCDAYGATVYEFDGTRIHWRAATGVSNDPAVRAAYEAQFPMVPTRDWHFGRAILDRRIIRIDDQEAEPGLNPTLRGITAKSNVTTPIMRGNAVIGAIGMGSREKGGFSDSQIELLKTFAEQAVIAITSAETYRALQTRTSDLQESLEYQTATSDVLKVISRSTFDLQPVLDTVVETAVRLCFADQAVIFRREGELYALAANFGFPAEYEAYWTSIGAVAVDLKSPFVGFRCIREACPVHIHDVAAVPGYRLWGSADQFGPAANLARRAAVARGRSDRNHRACAPAGRAIHRPTDRACQYLRRSSGHRDRKHAADDRAAGGAGTADRDGRSIAGYQRLARQSHAGVRCDVGKGDAVVWGSIRTALQL